MNGILLLLPSCHTDNILFKLWENTKSSPVLDPNKGHSHDGVSIRMLKLACSSIIKPFSLYSLIT